MDGHEPVTDRSAIAPSTRRLRPAGFGQIKNSSEDPAWPHPQGANEGDQAEGRPGPDISTELLSHLRHRPDRGRYGLIGDVPMGDEPQLVGRELHRA